MPYITTERVAEIRNEIKTAFPNFKFSVKREHTSSIHIDVLEGPIDFGENPHVNVYHFENNFEGEAKEFLKKVYSIANEGNRTITEDADYGSIPAFYLDISIGKWDKAYKIIEARTCIIEDGNDTAIADGEGIAEIRHNVTKNGIEIKFTKKPEDSIIEKISQSRLFRWSRFNKVWYSTVNTNDIQFAKQFGDIPSSLQVN